MGVKGTLAFGFLGDYFFCFLWLKFEDFSHQESMHFFYLKRKMEYSHGTPDSVLGLALRMSQFINFIVIGWCADISFEDMI